MKEGTKVKTTTIMIPKSFIYNYTCEPDEAALCELEKRSIFHIHSEERCFESFIDFEPSRSPFIRDKIGVILRGKTIEDLIEKIKKLPETKASFKLVYVHNVDGVEAEKFGFKKRRQIEREVGVQIPGEPELVDPDLLYGLIKLKEEWIFGLYTKSEAVWLHHQKKPHSYSVALNTRVARSVVNIAVPMADTNGIKVIDPCCGIGTVLVEALSMNIDIVGSDINYLILPGVRENLSHFGYEGEVSHRDIRDVNEKYDVAIIDLPYNLCSVITPQEQLEMLQSTYNFADKLVILIVEPIDPILAEAGFTIVDRGDVRKGTFRREVIVCKKVV